MPSAIEKLQAEAMILSPSERADLADRLWASIEPQADIDTAWNDEIVHRVAQLEAGEVETIPHEAAIARLHAKFG